MGKKKNILCKSQKQKFKKKTPYYVNPKQKNTKHMVKPNIPKFKKKKKTIL